MDWIVLISDTASAPPRAAARAGPRMFVMFGVSLTITGMRLCCLHQRVTISRSEEHTSELQSLMRNSYAVFCLKQKNSHSTNHINPSTHLIDTQNQTTQYHN